MDGDLRVPIVRTEAKVLFDDGAERSVILFVPPEQEIQEFLEQPQPFLPIEENGTILLYARSSIVYIEVPNKKAQRASLLPMDNGGDLDWMVGASLPEEKLNVHVHLRGGEELSGAIHFVPSEMTVRTVDLLNTPTSSLTLHGDGVVRYVSKIFVRVIKEERSS